MKRVFTLLFAVALTLLLSMPLVAQEASKEGAKETKEGAKETKEATGTKSAKQARFEGEVMRTNKDASTLTVRKRGETTGRTIHYDSSTRFVEQEHGSKKATDITANDIKDGDRVICMGHYDKGEFQATLISKRLTPR